MGFYGPGAMSPFFGGSGVLGAPLGGSQLSNMLSRAAQQQLQPLRCDFAETPQGYELTADVPGARPSRFPPRPDPRRSCRG